MATKIRLQRHGRKAAPYFHIVVADSRAKRDGKFIEKLGTYNPNHDPAKVTLDFDAAVKWVGTGAELTDTARSILSKEGVLLKNHLNGGVLKGALTEEEAEKKFEAWKKDKTSQVESSVKAKAEAEAKAKKEALAAETKVKEEREAALAAKLAEEQAEEVVEEETAEEAAPEAEASTEEAPAAEEASEEETKETAE